jgi:hypothetical protein
VDRVGERRNPTLSIRVVTVRRRRRDVDVGAGLGQRDVYLDADCVRFRVPDPDFST